MAALTPATGGTIGRDTHPLDERPVPPNPRMQPTGRSGRRRHESSQRIRMSLAATPSFKRPMHPLLSGTVALPVEEGARFDAGRFLSVLARRLQHSGASVRRHAATMTFEDLRLGNATRALVWCSGSGEVIDGASGPILQYSLRFGQSAWLMAAGSGVALAFYLWRYQSWTILRCLSQALILMFLVHGAEALVLMFWFRWTARQTARAVTSRAPRTAA
jgi:hypothetical protein